MRACINHVASEPIYKLLEKKCQNLKKLDCEFWYLYVTQAVSDIVKKGLLLKSNYTLKVFFVSLLYEDEKNV